MSHRASGAILAGAAFAMLASGGAALADVKAGVDAWSRGDYAAAVHEWQGPATAGDPDAMFNLAQAYRLGRGVPQDMAKAEELYAKAAAKGHIQAADTYGLMLFQDGRREAALPYIQDAAKRGDPRSEYLLGIASFNGDIVPKDWIKAYALLSMANSQGLPQATSALAQMDQNIPLAQRQQGAALAVQMQKDAEATRGRQLAAADLGAGVSTGGRHFVADAPVAQASPAAPPASLPASRPAAKIAVSPSVDAALAAVSQARQATGTESPAQAGASFARRSAGAPQVALTEPAPKPKVAEKSPPPKPATKPAPAATPTPEPKPAAVAKASEAKAGASAVAASGPWKVQLGAFAIRGNVDRLWTQLSTRGELAGKSKVTVPAGAMTKLQAGGFASRDDAETACRSLKQGGHDCLVTR